MEKRKLLEYLEGNPDSVYDTEKKITWSWNDEGGTATCFGFFPVSIDNRYEFLTGKRTHRTIAETAAAKLFGKAIGQIRSKYESYVDFIEDQCYDKSYGLGRIWQFDTPKYPSIMAFWYLPSSELLKEIVDKLGIDPSNFIIITEDYQKDFKENITVLEYIESGLSGDENVANQIEKPFRIDERVAEIIRSYNQPEETWQTQKEKKGWGTLAQRNAMLYQEGKNNKNVIKEYFSGNPDEVYDSNNKIYHNWNDGNAVSFGFFLVSLDDDFEFMSKKDVMHLELANNAANKVIGNSNLYIRGKYGEKGEKKFKDIIGNECMRRGYCRGRYWTFPRSEIKYPSLISFWKYPSSEQLKDICNRLGIDIDNTIYVQYRLKPNHDMTVREYIEESYRSEERPTTWNIHKDLIDIIKKYHDVDSSWAASKERKGWASLAQRNAMLYQENRQRIDEFFKGDPDTIYEYDDESPSELIRSIDYKSKNVISFGYFQTALNGGKEFIYKTDVCHQEICKEIAEKIVGKAIGSEYIGEREISEIRSSIYTSAAFKGRVFVDAGIITTWNRVSSTTLENLLNLMGGVDKWKNLAYIVPSWYDERWLTDEISDQTINVVDYINKGIVADETRDKYKMEKDFKDTVPEWIITILEEYNRPNSTLATKTAKLGNMTIAQYNSLIHQEEKEPKQTIKENNKDMKNNKYQEEFSNYITIMSEALQKDDYKAYEYVKQMLDEAIEDHKHEQELMNEMNTTNFGVLNHIFESELPTLIKTNKKAVKNVINTIKEDKNLKSQFSFYNVLKEKYNGKVADTAKSKEVLETLAKIVCENIDPKTVKASNRKLRKVMIESGVKPSDFVDEDSMKLYENGNVILTTKRNSDNTIELIESYNEVCKWMDAHKEDKKTGKDADELIREFEEKLKENLTESEISFVQQITDWRSPIAEQRKEKLFNKFKNECLEKINDMLKEDAENVELKGLSDQLSEMKFDKNNIVKDIAKLLEIRDILMDD